MAQDPADFQSHGGGAGKVEDDGPGLEPDRENLENAVTHRRNEAANLDRGDPVEGDAGQRPLEALAAAWRRTLPAKAVGDEHEALLVGEERHLGDGNERVLKQRR